MKYLLAILLLTATAQAETCICNNYSFDEAPDCCKQVIAWPGEVTGVPCYGPLCTAPDDSTCFCNKEQHSDVCKDLCHKRAVAVGLTIGIRVLPEKGLCLGEDFPFPAIGELPFGELYLDVFEGSGGFRGCTQDNALTHWEASWSTLRQQNTQINILQNELEFCYESQLPPPTPELPYTCSVTEDMIDGPGGAVWKPVSESDGSPVLLMPTSYCDTDVVDIYQGNRKVADMDLRDCAEFGRGVWRGAPRCSSLPNDLTLVFGTECRTVPDPCNRYD